MSAVRRGLHRQEAESLSVATNLRGHLVRSVAGSLGVTVANAALAFVNGVLLARLLGAEGYGIYASSIAVVLVLTLPLTLGLDRLLVREVAASGARSEWGLVRGLIVRSLQSVVPVSAAVAALVALVAWFNRSGLQDETLPTLWLALLMIPLLTLSNLRRAITVGLQHVVSALLPDSLVRPLLFLLLLLAALVTTRSLDPVGAMALNLATVVVAVSFGLALLWRQLPRAVHGARSAFETRRWLREAIPFAMLTAVLTFMGQADVVIVGGFSGAIQAGLYAVAARGAALSLFGTLAVNATLAPTVAQLWTQGDRARLQAVVTRAARGAFVFALAVAAVLWLAGPQVLLVFGDDFSAARPTLTLLALAAIVDTGLGLGGVVLSMTGFQALGFSAAISAAVVRVTVAVSLVPVLGAQGAAIGAICGVAVLNTLTALFAARRVGVDVTPLGLWRARRRVD